MSRASRFQFASAGSTHPGRVRTLNQDAFLALPELGVWVVADGVGGHQRGDAASRAIVDAVAALGRAALRESLAESVRQAILTVNHRLVEIAEESGPGTVIGSTVAVLVAQGEQCVCLWAGDSRIYGLRGGRLARLTRDHSEVEELVEQGRLSASEALRHPGANIIYRAVGNSDDLELDARVYDVYLHDKFLLCTDGLTKEVGDEEIAAILSHGNCHENCRTLMELVLSRPCRDNVAVIVVDVNAAGESEDTIPLVRMDAGRPPRG